MLSRLQDLCCRGLQTSAVRGCKKESEQSTNVTAQPKPSPSVGGPAKMPGNPLYEVQFLDKYYLVWTKRYKTVKDVPSHVDRDVIHRVRSIMRIRINLGTMVLAGLMAIVAVYFGKKEAEGGRNVITDNIKWHEVEGAKLDAKRQAEAAKKQS